MHEYDTTQPVPESSVADVADHVDHIRDLAGSTRSGSGRTSTASKACRRGSTTCRAIPRCSPSSRTAGTATTTASREIAGRNVLRVMCAAERVAAGAAPSGRGRPCPLRRDGDASPMSSRARCSPSASPSSSARYSGAMADPPGLALRHDPPNEMTWPSARVRSGRAVREHRRLCAQLLSSTWRRSSALGPCNGPERSSAGRKLADGVLTITVRTNARAAQSRAGGSGPGDAHGRRSRTSFRRSASQARPPSTVGSSRSGGAARSGSAASPRRIGARRRLRAARRRRHGPGRFVHVAPPAATPPPGLGSAARTARSRR